MSTTAKDELHQLIDQLDDRGAADALASIRRLLSQGRPGLTNGTRPALPPDPMTIERLYADILPEDETPDQLNETVRRWREGQDG